MKIIKQILRFLFNRSVVLDPGKIRSKIKCCEKFIFYDFIAMLLCAAVVVFGSHQIGKLFCFGLSLFSSWFMLDILQWNRFNNLYIKYFKGGVIFENSESETIKDSEKEIQS